MRILSVRLSVCQSRALWQNERKICLDFCTTSALWWWSKTCPECLIDRKSHLLVSYCWSVNPRLGPSALVVIRDLPRVPIIGRKRRLLVSYCWSVNPRLNFGSVTPTIRSDPLFRNTGRPDPRNGIRFAPPRRSAPTRGLELSPMRTHQWAWYCQHCLMYTVDVWLNVM